MDHSCEKCGSSVPDGRPFCPHCQAPQVRVEIAVSAPEPDRALTDSSAVSFPHSLGAGQTYVPDRASVSTAVLKASLLGVLLGMIPLLGSVLTGVVAVWFYRRAGGPPAGAGFGARLGGIAAASAFSISALFTVVQVFVFHAQRQSEETMLKFLGSMGANLSDPEILASIHRLFTPSGMVFSIIVGLIVSAALGAFGGAVTASSRPRPRL